MRLGHWIGELHRRFVWQSLGIYAVVAWIVLQLVDILGGLIGLPLWFAPASLIVVLLGFPVFLITALIQGESEKADPYRSRFHDSADGGDGSLSSWRHLESRPVRGLLRRLFTWRNALAGGVAMGILLGIGTVGSSGLRSAGIGPKGKGVLEPNESLILADFEDLTSDGTLGEMVTDLFQIHLSRSRLVRIFPRTELSQALVRMEKNPESRLTHDVAMELARREGVQAVVSGDVSVLGPEVEISVRLVAAGTGETLVGLRETAPTVEAVPEAVARLSAQLRERIGEPPGSIRMELPLQEGSTRVLQAPPR